MRDSDILEKQGFAEARKEGGHQLYVRARLKCEVGGHEVQKDFKIEDFEREQMKPEPWKCDEHR